MKKLLTLTIALCCTSALFAAKLYVYDFTASFKRIDSKKISVTDAGSNLRVKLDSAKVVSDKFTGYLVIEACEACNGEMVDSLDPENVAVLYVVRKNDSKKRVYRTDGSCEIAVFGSKSGVMVAGPMAGEMVNYNKITEAQLKLEVPFEFDLIDGIGFMGNRTFTDHGLLQLRGFGKVANNKWTETDSCFDTTYYCLSLRQAAGEFLMDYQMSGVCSNFLFDLCSAPNSGADSHAYGTYTVKLNKSLSDKADGWDATEQLILAKLKKSEVYGINDEFTESVGLSTAKTWSEVHE